jgi:DNA replication protein DnaD
MPINNLKINSITILNQISSLVKQINDNDYSYQLDLLNGNTVAKHIRHILELYVQFHSGIKLNQINYDKRERNLLIEHNKTYTITFINQLISKIKLIDNSDSAILLNTFVDNNEFLIKTSIERELVYNIEHAIHHMAIIQIACKHCFEYIKLDKNFGIAYATIQYQNTCAQ